MHLTDCQFFIIFTNITARDSWARKLKSIYQNNNYYLLVIQETKSMNAFKLFIFIFIFLGANATQQQPEGIEITVEKGHKKITYFAENITDQDLDLFFKVNSTGFRRNADRPMIETIPAKTKKALLTLIPLTGKDTTHTYMAVVTQKENNIELRKTDTIVKDVMRMDPKKQE